MRLPTPTRPSVRPALPRPTLPGDVPIPVPGVPGVPGVPSVPGVPGVPAITER